MDNRAARIQEELAFQAQRAAKIGEIGPTPDDVIERYRKNSLWWVFPKEMLFRSLQDISGKEILDMGCGEGELSTQLAKLGARVTGVDVSPELIQIAKRRAELDGVWEHTQFFVSDILESPLPENRFDIVLCFAVLHHVDIKKVLPLLWASLKPGGMAVLVEPLGLSPFLRKVRKLIPVSTDASPGERPLNRDELNFILQSFGNTRVTYYELFSRIQVLLPNWKYRKAVVVLLGCVDRFLLSLFPFLSAFSGEAVIVGRKPTAKSNA